MRKPMLEQATRQGKSTIFVAVSFVLAICSWIAPARQMPIDFHIVLWWSIPLATVWILMVAFSLYRFGKRALWMLLGAPLALYWFAWLLLKGLPACYQHGNCV